MYTCNILEKAQSVTVKQLESSFLNDKTVIYGLAD